MELPDAGSGRMGPQYPLPGANFSFQPQSLPIHCLPGQLPHQMTFDPAHNLSSNILQTTLGNIRATPVNIRATPGNIRALPGNVRALPGNIRALSGTIPGMSQAAVRQVKKLEMPPTKRSRLDFDEGGSDSEEGHVQPGSKQSSQEKRSQHCEVEKRRRERMNRYMAELAQMIPACTAVPRRLDKLSILKMTVDHMKSLRGDQAFSDSKPGFLTDEEMKQLVVEAANGFMLIIACTEGKVLFVSDTIMAVLNEEPHHWTGASLYDLLHPKDVQKVKEQLITVGVEGTKKDGGLTPPSASVSPQSVNGVRRSFLCRVKKTSEQASVPGGSPTPEVDCSNSEGLVVSSQHRVPCQYATLHCTGFIRHLTATEMQAMQVDDESSVGACLVAVARLQHFGDNVPTPKLEPVENEFVFRVGSDGRFTFADPRVTCVLGYLPQDLVGQISYEYYHPDDTQKMVRLHHDAMKQRTPMATVQYRFLTKSQRWMWLSMKAFSFTNPFSQQVDYVVCTNVTMLSSASEPPVSASVFSCREGSVPTATATRNTAIAAGPQEGRTSYDTDKLERTENYMQISVHNQAQALQASNLSVEETSAASIAHAGHFQTTPSLPLYNSTSSEGLNTEITSTLEENAATVQRILEDYNRMNMLIEPRGKEMSYKLPEAASNTEVDMLGSQQAYRNILTEFDNPADFSLLFDQVEADSMRPNSMLQDLNMDINF